MYIRKRIGAIALAVLMTLSLLPANALAAEEGSVLTLIHINDRHGRMDADPYISQMVRELSDKSENVLLLDAGDSLHGQTTTNLSKGAAMVELMNEVGYNAMAPGNHDFNFGLERLQELSESMEFPLLAANVRTIGGEYLFKHYEVFKLDGVTVGVFGLATPETVSKSDPRITKDLVFENPAERAAAMVDVLKAEECDIIIALAHLGVDDASSLENRSDTLAGIGGIDIIIDGHSHTALENGMKIGNTLIAQTGAFSGNIGVVEVALTGGVVTSKAKLVPVPTADEEPTLKADESIRGLIEAENAKTEPITGQVVGNTTVLLQGEREFVRKEETNLANAITDSMKYATNSDVAFLSGGNIRASIPVGEISMGQILTVLPFSNLLVTMELSGADLIDVLEHGVSKYPELAGSQIQVSGLRFTFDPDAEPMSRVIEAKLENGDAIIADKIYTVATIEFIAEGGDGYELVGKAKNRVYYQGDAEAMVKYLETSPVVGAEPERRMAIAKTDILKEAAPIPEPQNVPGAESVYTVKKGDTLTKIANSNGTTWQVLMDINGLKNPGVLSVGQKLKLPTGAAVPEQETYIVRPGDTLIGIARLFGIDWHELQSLNGIQNAKLIHPGQSLKLPSQKAA